MHLKALLLELNAVNTHQELNALRTQWFGKTGLISMALKSLGQMEPVERKEKSAELNQLKDTILQAIQDKAVTLEEKKWQMRCQQEAIDVTPPPPMQWQGALHPIMQVMNQVISIFARMGFDVRRGPDIETEFYNFDALNIPTTHPARADHDTFYLPHNYLLRTQTSSVQIRSLLEESPPLRIISPGRVYRCDHDRTHTPMFHQAEGLIVEPHITMGHLKGCLTHFLEEFFGCNMTVRFRPSFFPFTEPSAEVDIACTRKNGQLTLGSGGDWLEILGCGMVHPNVFRACHLPDTTQGFAFGMGLERLAMLKYGIEDIRNLYLNDQRWLAHYGIPPFTFGV